MNFTICLLLLYPKENSTTILALNCKWSCCGSNIRICWLNGFFHFSHYSILTTLHKGSFTNYVYKTRWSKNVHFLSTFIPYKMSMEVGRWSKKSQSFVNVVCERPPNVATTSDDDFDIGSRFLSRAFRIAMLISTEMTRRNLHAG